MTDTLPHDTHDSISCAELDRLAYLPTDDTYHLWQKDPLVLLAIRARRAQIHLEMRLALLRAEEDEQTS